MATLEKIRSKAGIMIFIIAFALLCFIVGDFLSSATTLFGMSRNVVGEVNDESLSIEDFTKMSETVSEIQKSQRRQQLPDAELKEAVWNTYVSSTLIEQEAEKSGLKVTPAELSENTIGSTPHPMLRQVNLFYDENGQFNPQMVSSVIRFIQRDPSEVPAEQRAQFVDQQNSIKKVWMFWEGRIKSELASEKVSSVLANALSAPNAEVKFMEQYTSQEFDALVAKKMYADVADADVEVSDADINNYYNKNKESYKTEGYRNVQIVMFPISPSKNDYDDAMAQMQEVKENLSKASTADEIRSVFVSYAGRNYGYNDAYFTSTEIGPEFGDFAMSNPAGTMSDIISRGNNEMMVAKVVASAIMRPDSVKISMIAVQDADTTVAKNRADSIANAIKAGAKFEDMVSKHSVDQGSAQNGGDLGWVREGYISFKGFDDKAFNAQPGTIFTVNNEQAAFVIKVTEKTAPVKKAKIAILGVPFEASSATLDSIYAKANELATNNRTCDEFLKAASENNYMARPLTHLTQNQASVYVIPDSRSIVKWAWEHEKGDVSDVMEIGDNYIVLGLENAIEEGYEPLDVVKEDIKTEVTKEKKAEKLASELSNVSDLAAVGTVDTVKAVRYNNSYITKVGNEPALTGAIVSSTKDQISAPVKGNSAVYVFKTIESRQSSVPAASKQALNSAVMQNINRNLFEAMKDKAEIEDNRYRFF